MLNVKKETTTLMHKNIIFFSFRFISRSRTKKKCCILTTDAAELSGEKCACGGGRCIRSRRSGGWPDITRVREEVRQLEFRAWSQCSRLSCGNQLSAERLGHQGPRLSSPREEKGGTAVAGRAMVWSICCSRFQSPTYLSHTTLSIKWELYFSKELCPPVVIASLCFCKYMCMYSWLWLYNKSGSLRIRISPYVHWGFVSHLMWVEIRILRESLFLSSTFGRLLQGHIKALNHLSFFSLLYIRESGIGSSPVTEWSSFLLASRLSHISSVRSQGTESC